MNTSQETHLLNILIVGGCHVDGFPVNKEHGFVSLLEKYFVCQIHTLPYVTLSDASKILSVAQTTNPDLLILQIGNYEFPYPLKKRLRTLLPLRLANNLKNTTPNPAKHPQPTQTAFQHAISIIKIFSNFILGFFPFPFSLVYRAKDIKSLNYLLDFLHCHSSNPVLVISPFPSKCLWINYSRKHGSAILKKECHAKRISYLDLFDIPHATDPSLYWDFMHYNELGHYWLSSVIQSKINNLTAAQ